MKILVYINQKKDFDNSFVLELQKIFQEKKIEYEQIFEADFNRKIDADFLLILGGDGTILRLINFALLNDIAILGINAGRIGFLTEFEKKDTLEAINLAIDKKLKVDSRIVMEIKVKDKVYYSLNDIVIKRIIDRYSRDIVADISVDIDNNKVEEIRGDGIIVSTPTGSTAYSLSAGGPILAPGINAFSLTPLSAHSLNHRPIIYSADSKCNISIISGETLAIFIDGTYFCDLYNNDNLTIKKSERTIKFLRRIDNNFYKRLLEKLTI